MYRLFFAFSLLIFSPESSKSSGYEPLSKEYDFPVEMRLTKQFLENNKTNIINVGITHLHYGDAEFVDHEYTFHTINLSDIFNAVEKENLEDYSTIFSPEYPFNAMTLNIVLGGYIWSNRINGGSKMTENPSEGVFISEKRSYLES